MIIFIDSTDSG